MQNKSDLSDGLFADYEALIDEAMQMPSGDARGNVYSALHDVRMEIIKLDILAVSGVETTRQEHVVATRLNKARSLMGKLKQ